MEVEAAVEGGISVVWNQQPKRGVSATLSWELVHSLHTPQEMFPAKNF